MIVSDRYFIAVLGGDLEMAQHIWREAWMISKVSFWLSFSQ
jgi:hypothetical protein